MQLMDKYHLHLPGARFDSEPVPSMLTGSAPTTNRSRRPRWTH